MGQFGKLIVIDGSDGSGKQTQTDLLVRRMRDEGHRVEPLSFPRYNDTFYGTILADCLNPKSELGRKIAERFGGFSNVDPRVASILFTAERHESRDTIEGWISDGVHVVCDRYFTSNLIHQGGKVEDLLERDELVRWLGAREGNFGVREPHKVIFLDVPPEVSIRLLRESDRDLDAVELDEDYLRNSHACAVQLADINSPQWVRVECTKAGEMLTRDEIHCRVWEAVKPVIAG